MFAVQTKRMRSRSRRPPRGILMCLGPSRAPQALQSRRTCPMNAERLLREVERRLSGLPEDARREAVDAVREEISRERRRSGVGERVEVERERRQEAETLREILEAI